MGLAAGLLWVAALQGSFGVVMWMLASGSLLVLTALYALGFRRRTWAGLDTVEQRKFALGLGSVVLVVGIVTAVVSTPQPVTGRVSADAEGLRPRPDLFALPTAPAPGSVLQVPLPPRTEEATGDSLLDGSGSYALLGEVSQMEPDDALTGTPCTVAGSSRTQGQTVYRCTRNSAGDLAWLDAASAQQLVEERMAESQRAEAARQEERARQAENDARLEQERAQQRAAEEQTRAERDAPAPQPPAQPNEPQPPADNPRPPPVEPPVGPPVEPPPEPPTEPPMPPPSPDPTVPPPDPPTPPGPPDPPVPGTPDPDIPVIPPEFPVPPSPPARERPVQPPSSFAPPSATPEATEAAAEQVLPAAR
ncbi:MULTISPECIES: hypothetical protein [unclassified Arthrobacter]|uniref:hypothetical protein n=1 Tax=unclassified Arthrobacter TaxID=235627 RepID=UPI001E486B73|nr:MULTISPECIES: hypothetical protein [unclassified Arthrobacter]MCC9145942.1 hypothetical protein [Arthrobacter sp. zg-Y919]MDK1277171.1 hypothetical protein [Arthrobacter sp. zg.Y919]WIB03688.1 hypothetical protein QNO10_03125 [Arthrobacter sp. zg-Y919]